MGVNSLPRTVTKQGRGCDLNPGLSAPVSSTLTTRTFACVIGVGSPVGGGDHWPDPAPFPADDGTPSPPADDQHSRQWRAHNGRWEVMGERDRGRQRPSARGRRAGESPRPAVGHRWTIGRRHERDGRVKRRAAAGSLAPWRTCQNWLVGVEFSASLDTV